MWVVADYAKDPGKEAGMSSPKHDLALRKPRNQHSIYRKHLERKPLAYILPVFKLDHIQQVRREEKSLFLPHLQRSVGNTVAQRTL